MSAETLRRAASLMRERAEEATAGEWVTVTASGCGIAPNQFSSVCMASTGKPENATHIASWHPAAAIAVADLLTYTAGKWDAWGAPKDLLNGGGVPEAHPAMVLARAYLGDQP